MSAPGQHGFSGSWWAKRVVPTQPLEQNFLFVRLLPSTHTLSQSVNSRGGSCLHHRWSSELSYSCSYCLSGHTDKVWLCCASPGQQSTQKPPSVAISIRLYQMLHSPCQPGLLRDELISSSTWCTEGRSRHPWGPASRIDTHTQTCAQKAWAGYQDNLQQ